MRLWSSGGRGGGVGVSVAACCVRLATRRECDAMRCAPSGWAFATGDWRWGESDGATLIYLNRARAGNEVRVDS